MSERGVTSRELLFLSRQGEEAGGAQRERERELSKEVEERSKCKEINSEKKLGEKTKNRHLQSV